MKNYHNDNQRKHICLTFMTILILSLLIGFHLAPGVYAQETDTSKDKEQSVALATISKYCGMDGEYVEQFMEGHDNVPPHEWSWRHFPVIRKLEADYLAAENAKQGGGERFLALLVHDLSRRQYEAIQGEPSLQAYFDGTYDLNEPLLFKVPVNPKIFYPLPTHVISAISTLAKYCEGSKLEGTYGVLKNYFELSDETAYEILRSCSTNHEALLKGIAYVPTENRNAVLTKLVEDLGGKYETSLKESSLDPFRASSKVVSTEVPPHAHIISESVVSEDTLITGVDTPYTMDSEIANQQQRSQQWRLDKTVMGVESTDAPVAQINVTSESWLPQTLQASPNPITTNQQQKFLQCHQRSGA